MGQLPIEDGAQAFGAEDDVADPIVAVHERVRRVGGQASRSQRKASSKTGCGSGAMPR